MNTKTIIILAILLSAVGIILIGLLGEQGAEDALVNPEFCNFTVGAEVGGNLVKQGNGRKILKMPKVPVGETLTIYLSEIITYDDNATNSVDYATIIVKPQSEQVKYHNLMLVLDATKGKIPDDLVIIVEISVEGTALKDTLVISVDTTDEPIIDDPPF